MQSNTQSVTIRRDPVTVFEYVAGPLNLPQWATEFCQDVRPHGDDWLVTTTEGDVPVAFRTDPEAGVVDFVLRPAPGVEVVAASRVLPNGDGAEYVFTQFQAPGMPDEAFDGQVAALRRELDQLKDLLEN